MSSVTDNHKFVRGADVINIYDLVGERCITREQAKIVADKILIYPSTKTKVNVTFKGVKYMTITFFSKMMDYDKVSLKDKLEFVHFIDSVPLPIYFDEKYIPGEIR